MKPPWILNDATDHIFLTYVINQILETGTVPSVCKLSIITAICKKGDRTQVVN